MQWHNYDVNYKMHNRLIQCNRTQPAVTMVGAIVKTVISDFSVGKFVLKLFKQIINFICF